VCVCGVKGHYGVRGEVGDDVNVMMVCFVSE
jgi:hypothetical protein